MASIPAMKYRFLGIILLGYISGAAQHITDYVAGYAYPTTSLPRQNIDVNYRNELGSNAKFESDGKDIFYIINGVGDSKFSSFEDDIDIIEPTFKDTFNSELIFLKYNLTNRKFTAKTFGSNYMNSVFRVSMDEQRKSICTVISTCGDTVRLNPDNKSEIIVYPSRLQRYWLLTFDLQGKLISNCLLAESPYSLSLPLNNSHLSNINISKFDFNGNVILGFQPNSKVLKILPGKFHDSIKLVNGESYFFSFSQKTSKIEWLRKIKNGLPDFFRYTIPGEKYMMAINLSKKPNSVEDSTILITDENDKVKIYITSFTAGLRDKEVLTFVFKVDQIGNVTQFMDFKSKDNSKNALPTRITSMLQNKDEVLAIITSSDSINIFNKSLIGRPDKNEKTSSSQLARRYILVKLNFNTQNVETIGLLNFKDSIIPKKLFKAKSGFYISFSYSNTSKSYNILPTDSVINFKDDILFNYPSQYNLFNTLCRYDSVYKLKWIHKSSFINSISDYGNITIIDYSPDTYYDLNFRAGIIGSIKPKPILVMAGIYNCNPIAYFDTIQKGNMLKFINLSEYNSHYKWDFGNGIISNLKSPSHIFNFTNALDYRISLVVTNTCGSDTFVRYFRSIADIEKYNIFQELKIYPNPTYGNIFFIKKPINLELNSIQLFNLHGQLIEDFSIEKIESNAYKLQLKQNLPRGIYYLKSVTKNNVNYTSKIFIQQ